MGGVFDERRILYLASLSAVISKEMHETLAEIFGFGATRVDFVEWGDECPQEIKLTLPQYWRKVCGLKMTSQWLNSIRRVCQDHGLQDLLDDPQYTTVTVDTEDAKWALMEFMVTKIVNPNDFTVRKPTLGTPAAPIAGL